MNGRLQRFNRLLVWPTLILLMLLAFSGYGTLNSGLVRKLTGGLLNRPRSFNLHTDLVLPTLTLLMIHVLIALRKTLIRWGISEGRFLDAFLILLGVFTVTVMIVLQYLEVY